MFRPVNLVLNSLERSSVLKFVLSERKYCFKASTLIFSFNEQRIFRETAGILRLKKVFVNNYCLSPIRLQGLNLSSTTPMCDNPDQVSDQDTDKCDGETIGNSLRHNESVLTSATESCGSVNPMNSNGDKCDVNFKAVAVISSHLEDMSTNIKVKVEQCVGEALEVAETPQKSGISDNEETKFFISIACQCTPKINEESIVVPKNCWTDDEGTQSDGGEEDGNEKAQNEAGADKEKGGAGDGRLLVVGEKRKAEDTEPGRDLKKAKLETKALKAKRPGFTDDRYNETSYYIENGLRKVYPYYFTFTTFTKGRWVGERILDVFAREFRAHPAEEYERCIRAGTLTVNYEKVDVDYRLKHNDLLANVVHRHEVPVTSEPITIVHMDEDVVVVNKPASIPVHPCGRYRHNTVVFILAKEYNLRNLRTIHRLDRLTSGLLLFGRTPKKARAMEHQIRNRQVVKEYVCRVEGDFPSEVIECEQPIEVVSYKIGVCKVSPRGKHCTTTFQKLGFNGKTSVISCKPHTGRMHQIRVHLQYLGYPVVNDPLYNHTVFGPEKGRGGKIGKSDEELIRDLINIHNAENWLGMDGDSELSMFKRTDMDEAKGAVDEEADVGSREPSPCDEAGDGGDSPSVPATVPTAVPVPSSPAPSVSAPSRPPAGSKVTVATQTGQEAPDLTFNADKLTWDEHCYECKVRYRDPKPKDLVMYLHAWKYKGPGWSYETELPDWARVDWVEEDE